MSCYFLFNESYRSYIIIVLFGLFKKLTKNTENKLDWKGLLVTNKGGGSSQKDHVMGTWVGVDVVWVQICPRGLFTAPNSWVSNHLRDKRDLYQNDKILLSFYFTFNFIVCGIFRLTKYSLKFLETVYIALMKNIEKKKISTDGWSKWQKFKPTYWSNAPDLKFLNYV